MFLGGYNSLWNIGSKCGGGWLLGHKTTTNIDNSLSYKTAFDPNNDPVVYTTDYGLQIRYSSALTNTNLAGYTYFSAGGYNWVIIGYDPSLKSCVGEYPGELIAQADPIQGGHSLASTIDDSPMGTAIIKEMLAISNLAVENDEIGEGCVLCYCEISIGEAQFNTSTSQGNNYKGSNMQNYIDNTLYGSTSELSKALQALPIKPQQLTTVYSGGISTIDNAYLFPLAGDSESESFYISSYLNTDSLRDIYVASGWSNDDTYWLRSGNPSNSTYPYYVYYNGIVCKDGNSTVYVNYSRYIRPAFVLQLV